MRQLIVAIAFLGFCGHSIADTQKVPRLDVKIMLQSTGKHCDTFASTMQDEHLVCVKDTWHLRYYQVTYRFRGELRTVNSLTYPAEIIEVDDDGNIVKLDTSMHGSY